MVPADVPRRGSGVSVAAPRANRQSCAAEWAVLRSIRYNPPPADSCGVRVRVWRMVRICVRLRHLARGRRVKVTVGIASLCTERQIARCLRALNAQIGDPSVGELDLIVAHNRPAAEIERLRKE